MKRKQWLTYVVSVVLAEAVGFLAAVLSREGTQYFIASVAQPPLSPPAAVFPIVWGILYALMGISAGRIWLSSESVSRDRGINLYIIQLVMNFFWTLIFFNLRAYGLASVWLIVLWLVVLAMILQYYKVDRLAAWLQIPYLAWLTFAAYLTLGVWILNR